MWCTHSLDAHSRQIQCVWRESPGKIIIIVGTDHTERYPTQTFADCPISTAYVLLCNICLPQQHESTSHHFTLVTVAADKHSPLWLYSLKNSVLIQMSKIVPRLIMSQGKQLSVRGHGNYDSSSKRPTITDNAFKKAPTDHS